MSAVTKSNGMGTPGVVFVLPLATAALSLASVEPDILADTLAARAAAGAVSIVELHSFLRDVHDHHMPMLIDAERGASAQCNYGHKAVSRLDEVIPGKDGRD